MTPFLNLFLIFLSLSIFCKSITAINWTSCPLNSDYEISVQNLYAFCTKVPVELGRNEEKIDIFVKRFVYDEDVNGTHSKLYRSMPAASAQSLWLIPGIIPGDTFDRVEKPIISLIEKGKGKIDAFTFDIRGTGLSRRLGCQLSQAESPGSPGGVEIVPEELKACISEFGNDYEYFTTDQAATDLLRLISQLKVDKDIPLSTGDIYLYGHSFSTVLVQRAIQIHENSWENKINNLKGIVLDSVFNIADDSNYDMKRFVMEDVNENYNQVGFELLHSVCNLDEACASRFFDEKTYQRINPAELLIKVFDDLYKRNSCLQLTSRLTADKLRYLLGWLLTDFKRREVIPALIYRLNRCNEVGNGDIATILHLVDEWESKISKKEYRPRPESPILLRNLLFNELISPSFNISKSREQLDDSYFALHGILELLSESNEWPLYTVSPYFNISLSIPNRYDVLILSGELDPLTLNSQGKALYSQLIDQRKDSEVRTFFVSFPFVQNYVLENAIKRNNGDACGVSILQHFMTGVKVLDISCATDLLRIVDFSGSPSLNEELLGASDIWEGWYTEPGSTINLYTFIGIESATLVLFTLLLCVAIYIIILQYFRIQTMKKNYIEPDEIYAQYDTM